MGMTMDDANSGMDLATGGFGLMKSIGQLNAQGKFKAYMHRNTMQVLAAKLKQSKVMSDLDNVSAESSYRTARNNAEAKSTGDVRGNGDSLRSLSANINALNSQVV